MANLTVSADGVIRDGNRVSVRTSTGRVYVCYTNTNDGIFMSKGNVDGEPASFSVADSITGITLLLEQGMACAIDSLDIIHCMFIVLNSNHSGIIAVRYVQFDTSTDTFGSPETIQLLDASLNQLAIRENMGIALDSNDDPHVIWKDVDTNMGADTWTNYYSNKTGASWRTRVAIFTGITSDEIIAYDIMVADPLSSVNADRPIIVMYDDGTALAINVYYGDALDSTAFTEELDVTGSTVVGGGHVSFAIDSNEKITIAFVEETTRDLMIVEHLNASAWTSWETPIQVASDFNYDSPSIAITCGTDRYIFVTNANDDIRLWKDNGSGWTQETDDTDLPNIGTFNDVKVKWANYWNNTKVYFFDGHTQILDNNNAWTDDANAFDGSTSTAANDATGLGQTNSLEGHGTNTPSSGGIIKAVTARIRFTGTSTLDTLQVRIYNDGQTETLFTGSVDDTTTPAWVSLGAVTPPTGGWTWGKLQELEVEFWWSANVSLIPDDRVFVVELRVDVEDSLELDYLFEDASGNLLYNTWLAPCDVVVRSEFWHGYIPQPLF